MNYISKLHFSLLDQNSNLSLLRQLRIIRHVNRIKNSQPKPVESF